MKATSVLPVYEKQNDRIRQRIIADRFIEAMKKDLNLPNSFRHPFSEKNWNLIDCPYKYVNDYFVTTDYHKVIAVLECKWYWKEWRDYNYLQPISLHKLKHLLDWSKLFNVPSYMLIRNRDGLYYLPVEEHLFTKNEVKYYGRVDRGNPNDLEPMIFIEERYWYPYVNGMVNIDG